jgi:hypothetical protein
MTTDQPVRPLGVRPDVSLTDSQLRSLQVLQDYDLSPIRNRLLHVELMPLSYIDPLLFEFRRYLGLTVITQKSMPMFSRLVDQVWHTTLLFTRLYADLCQQAFGIFLHHDPATETSPDPVQSWREFEEAYTALYGEVSDLWQAGRPTP